MNCKKRIKNKQTKYKIFIRKLKLKKDNINNYLKHLRDKRITLKNQRKNNY